MHKYIFFLRYDLLTGFTLYTCIKTTIKVVFLEKNTDLISVTLPNFKVINGTIIAFYGKNKDPQ